MSAAALVSAFRARGVELIPDGGALRYRAPRGVLTDADLEALRAHKAALLAELRGQPDRPDHLGAVGGDDVGDHDHLVGGDHDLAAGPVLETREQPGAVLIRSARFGRDVWLALTEDMAAELRAEEAERPEPRPVLTPADVARLRGKPAEAVRAVLEVAAVFGTARVLQ
jgi:hypothetical protein